ncbi:MAG TPA: alpha/beta hydrolase [Anaerolineae bacterium]
MNEPHTYLFKQAHDCSIYADVYPAGGPGPHPAILWLHGGALIFGDRTSLSPAEAQVYLNDGYTVVTADYRIAPETKLEAIVEDVQDAYRWLVRQGPALFNIDPARIAVIGPSAGGYLTLLMGHRVSPRPRALVSFYGYGDIVGAWYSCPDPYYSQQPRVTDEDARSAVGTSPLAGSTSMERFMFYLYTRQNGVWAKEVAGHDPAHEPAWFEPYCPLRNVGADYPPTLLIHGDQDTDVPCEQSRLMAAELARCGVAHELVIVPGHGHNFDHQGDGLRDPVVAGVYARVQAFLRERMG